MSRVRKTTTWTNNRRPLKRRRFTWANARVYSPYRNPVRSALPRNRAPLATRGFVSNPELKSFDNSGANFIVSTSGDFTNLCFPASGGDINQRVGRKITLKSYYIRARVALTAAETIPAASITIPCQEARMIVFVDFQPNGALPTVLDLLQINSPVSQLNLGNRERFKVLSDKCYPFDCLEYSGSDYLSCNRTIHCIKKYKDINVDMIFSGATGSISDVKTGVLYMFWIGSSPALTAITCTFSSRVRYMDV